MSETSQGLEIPDFGAWGMGPEDEDYCCPPEKQKRVYWSGIAGGVVYFGFHRVPSHWTIADCKDRAGLFVYLEGFFLSFDVLSLKPLMESMR